MTYRLFLVGYLRIRLVELDYFPESEEEVRQIAVQVACRTTSAITRGATRQLIIESPENGMR